MTTATKSDNGDLVLTFESDEISDYTKALNYAMSLIADDIVKMKMGDLGLGGIETRNDCRARLLMLRKMLEGTSP